MSRPSEEDLEQAIYLPPVPQTSTISLRNSGDITQRAGVLVGHAGTQLLTWPSG